MTTTFNITAGPNTDIWRKPPTTDVFNAPTASAPSPSGPSGPFKLSTFLSARASFSSPWREQYDQAGLLLNFRLASSSNPHPEKWIKTGIEFYNGVPMLSTVACDRWADWSVTPLPTLSSSGEKTWTTISIEREKDGMGDSLWVYLIQDDDTKIPLREICWVYGDEDPDIWTLEVLAMACRPEKNTIDNLVAQVKDMKVEWSS
ncbi:hypothetical protein B0H66DRAFT_497588 [Apodospora peruviana]|uniref:Uncharacterized protein n=1 Tax=Apodospora peruviana TaxID=516989 RepID=A0AAE0I626_9PEZI|nr:hypothetical protein B0H66DRAFT_497588 [Apodospora peruviana]